MTTATKWKLRKQEFNPAVLPMEFRPRMAHTSDPSHTPHFLFPGMIFVAAQPFAITTIIGSGVVLCIWDPVYGIGGANHYMFPEGPDDGPNASRYASNANPALLKRLVEAGAEPGKLQAKIFGGTLRRLASETGEHHLGERNVEAAVQFLKLQGIRLVQSHEGGPRGRKVIFHTDDGRTWMEAL